MSIVSESAGGKASLRSPNVGGLGTMDSNSSQMQWENWQDIIRSQNPDALKPLPETLGDKLIDPLGGQMIRGGGLWRNHYSGSVFVCKNILFEMVENCLKPVSAGKIFEPLRKSPANLNVMMEKYTSTRLPNLVVDRCPTTGGFYVNSGELEKLKSLEVSSRLADDEEYPEYRRGFYTIRSRHRWVFHGRTFGPGLDWAGIGIKFRIAVFFSNPHPEYFSIKSLTWLSWLLGFVSNNGLDLKDKDFEGRFRIVSSNPLNTKKIITEEFRKELINLSKISMFREKPDIEVTNQFISFTEGPYLATENYLGSTREELEQGFFDKSEIVLSRLLDIAEIVDRTFG